MKKFIYFIVTLFVSTQIYANNIVLLSPFPPGGSADQILRTIEKNLLSEGIISNIEYKPGAGGSIAATYLANSKKNNIFMLPGISLFSNQNSKNYNIFEDFEIVSFIGIESTILVVNSKNKIKNFNDFIEFSKNEFMAGGIPGLGTNGHFTSLILANNNKNIKLIPYKGERGIVNALLTNEISWGLVSKAVALPLIKENILNPILIWGPKSLNEISNVPTAKNMSINDFDFYRWHILITNKNADSNIKNKLIKIISSSKFKNDLNQIGVENFDIFGLENFFLNQQNLINLINKSYQN